MTVSNQAQVGFEKSFDPKTNLWTLTISVVDETPEYRADPYNVDPPYLLSWSTESKEEPMIEGVDFT